ncbi:phospholipid-translocating P-type ATPase, flippase [Trichuris suis]|nr:phospholipid-translocating P-type ATPase, flippase [Trichuris suis]
MDKPKTVSCFKNPIYEAESPDELALVHAAASYGIRLAKRQGKQAFIQMPNRQVHAYDVLHVLAFSPERRRMSVIVKQSPGNQLFLYCKGADTTIFTLLSKKFCESRRGIHCIKKTKGYLQKYSSLGLRTLCLAKRSISMNEYRVWLNQHHSAELAHKNRGELLEMSASMIERDLELLGTTAVEDRLQPGVPECIRALRSAGINIWVLTGDKTETAVNIAYACNLFNPRDELLYIDTKNWLDTDATLEACLDKTGLNRMGEEMLKKKFFLNFGLVIDGRTLPGCINTPLVRKFLKLISHCPAVLCTRSTPQQKAMVVELVKKRLHSLTLAVGDGANDVPMLQSADVGVGISGKEGMHAVIASDFSMPRFKYLQRLLLVHGHWCYNRLARLILYFFYKNSVMVFLMFFFQAFCGFSSQAIIDPVYQNFFNVVFTAMPPMNFGILEEDIKGKHLMANPHLYVLGRENQIFCTRKFALTILDSSWQAAVIFAVATMFGYGTDLNMCEMSFLTMSCLNLCCQFHLLLETQKLTFFIAFIFMLNLGTFYAVSIIYNMLSVGCCSADPPYMVAQRMLSEERYWTTVLLSVVTALLPRMIYRYFYSTMFSQEAQLAHKMHKEEEEEERKRKPKTTSAKDLHGK